MYFGPCIPVYSYYILGVPFLGMPLPFPFQSQLQPERWRISRKPGDLSLQAARVARSTANAPCSCIVHELHAMVSDSKYIHVPETGNYTITWALCVGTMKLHRACR